MVTYQDIVLCDRPPRVRRKEAVRGGEDPFAIDHASSAHRAPLPAIQVDLAVAHLHVGKVGMSPSKDHAT